MKESKHISFSSEKTSVMNDIEYIEAIIELNDQIRVFFEISVKSV